MSSRFSRYLHTNYAPTDDEQEEIKNLLVEPRVQLRKIEKQIEELQAERDKIATHIEAHEALLSPMRRLPGDILQEIFFQCVPKGRNPAMSAHEAPTLLGRICHEWRVLAFATPALWARLHVVEPFSSYLPPVPSFAARKAKLEQRLDAARTWLDRSGQCPLSISFQQDGDNGLRNLPGDAALPVDEDSELRMVLLRLVIKYASRWEHIDMTVPIVEHAGTALSALALLKAEDVPQLASCRIKSSLWAAGDDIPWESLQLLHQPQLTRLSIGFCGSLSHLNKLRVHWNRLVKLELSEASHSWISPGEVLEVLDKCSALRVCKLVLPDSRLALPPPGAGPQTFPTSIVCCPELRSLQLSGTFKLLTLLDCPQLQALDVRGRSTRFGPPEIAAHPPNREILEPIISSTGSLETFRYRVGNISESELKQVLELLPSTLRELEILDNSSRPQVDDELVSSLATPGRFPHLEDLLLRNCEFLSIDGIVAFLCKIAEQQPCSFKHLTVQYGTPPEDSDTLRVRVQPFIDAGILVTVRSRPPLGQFSPFHGLKLTNAEVTRFFWSTPDEQPEDDFHDYYE
uniref:F-box domain-containing protein n=1 Tax=Mycena chlorophos TaxID=658473 RepID=A0ABQ0LE80_MYCCL|nr:predicted protein [Mycena chlorophos]